MEEKKKGSKLKQLLENDKSLQNLRLFFLEKRGLEFGAPSLVSYTKAVARFCSYLNKTPDEVIEEAKAGKLLLYDPETRSGVLEDYKKQLLFTPRSTASIKQTIACIKTWLKVNGVKLDLTNFVLPRGRTKERDEVPSDETLKLLMQNATLRMKTAIAILASSGVRVSALLGLKLKYIALDYDPSTGISKITVPALLSKNGFEYTAFMSSEATKLLKQYLEYRRKKLKETLSEESFVIVGENKKALTYNAFRLAWRRLLRKCGLAKKSYKYHVYHVHVLRKWFRTKAEELTPSVREKLLGHRGGYLDESYFRITEEQLLNEYKKIHAYLLILEGPGATLKIAKEQSRAAVATLEALARSALVAQGMKKRELEQKIMELKQLLERNPDEASKLVLSWLQK
ncbi:MAG: tyrosine-type recombinase/integrase [Candidatus Nanoarchaeia archaeon]